MNWTLSIMCTGFGRPYPAAAYSVYGGMVSAMSEFRMPSLGADMQYGTIVDGTLPLKFIGI
jgi:hypothetical protein